MLMKSAGPRKRSPRDERGPSLRYDRRGVPCELRLLEKKMLPNFLHAGASKCASSWLWRVCIEHPDIYVPDPPDNVNFFTVGYHRGLEWYERTYFADWNGEKAVGEFSNSYMIFEPALQRIARHLPDVRLTMTLRDPIRRAYLSWAHVHRKGKYGFDPARGIGIPFEKALHHHGHQYFRAWLAPGFYAWHLERMRRYFDPGRMLVMLHEDLYADPEAWLQRFFEFLEVDADFRPELIGKQVNPDVPGSDPYESLSPELIDELRDIYREDVEQLQEMLGRDLSHWLTGNEPKGDNP